MDQISSEDSQSIEKLLIYFQDSSESDGQVDVCNQSQTNRDKKYL